LLPILSLIFIIGWFMYFVGGIKEDKRKAEASVRRIIEENKKVFDNLAKNEPVDPDTLQLKDELDSDWVKKWRT